MAGRELSAGAKILPAVVLLLTPLAGCTPSIAADKDDTYYPIRGEEAGEYQTVGPRGSERCLWNRAEHPSRDAADVIEVGEAKPGRNTTIRLRAGDYFISWGCYPWRRQ